MSDLPSPKRGPTTIRLRPSVIEKIDNLAITGHNTRNGIISLAVDALLDFAERTGKLPLPRAPRRRNNGASR